MTRSFTAHRLELVPLQGDGWRLCDTSVPADDPAHLIAYIERLDDGVGVVWLYGAFGHDRYGSVEEALDVAADLLVRVDEQTRRRPVAIPHLPPRPRPRPVAGAA
jgi:hypothetical protein